MSTSHETLCIYTHTHTPNHVTLHAPRILGWFVNYCKTSAPLESLVWKERVCVYVCVSVYIYICVCVCTHINTTHTLQTKDSRGALALQ